MPFNKMHALVEAVISYGLNAYGLTFPVHINKVRSLQIRLLKLLISTKEKIALKGNYEQLFKMCKILPIESKVKVTILTEQYDKNRPSASRARAQRVP